MKHSVKIYGILSYLIETLVFRGSSRFICGFTKQQKI
jgi:hypothetical protein